MEEEGDLDDAGEFEQLYLLEMGPDLFSRVISRPVRRVSRKHKAPLSLEKIQTHLIGKWKSGVKSIADCDMDEVVDESEVFGEERDDWEIIIETSLKLMGSWKWMRCPGCLSAYI
jgi:hypothetical protein